MRPALIASLVALTTLAPLGATASNPSKFLTEQPIRTSTVSVKACAAKTETFIESLVKGNYKAAFENFDNKTHSKPNAEAFGAFWQELGTLRSRGISKGTVNKGLVKITVALKFEEGNLIAHLSCNQNGIFDSFKLTPNQQHLSASTTSSIFNETEIEIGNSPLALDATLTLPRGKGPFPGVVLVSGAGPHDCDETTGLDKPLRDIALGLAAHGIATVRYDKPTFDHPLAFIGKPYTIDDEFTYPAIDAFNLLRSEQAIDPQRVFVLGHSQGGEMAPRIGQHEPLIAGLILVNAPAQSLSKYFQTVQKYSKHLASLYPKFSTQIRQQATLAKATQKWLAQVDSEHPDTISPDGLPASYWLSLRDYKEKIIPTAKSLKQPMLILQGGQDQSVSPHNDFGLWQQAFTHDPRATLKEYPTLTHLMMPSENPNRTFEKTEHVDPQVITDIAQWIKTRKPNQ